MKRTIFIFVYFLALVTLSGCSQHGSLFQQNYSFYSMKGYKSKGFASWYGTKFHHHKTSSGEKYNMYAMTAAHRTLPLNSYVRVKNLSNGRSVVVRINDRGPFFSRRIIDLSYGAARKLGILPKGTVMVEIQPIYSKQLAFRQAYNKAKSSRAKSVHN